MGDVGQSHSVWKEWVLEEVRRRTGIPDLSIVDFMFGQTEVNGVVVCHVVTKHMVECVKQIADPFLVQVHDGNFKNNKDGWFRVGSGVGLCFF